jgi:plastocyanin
MLVMSSVGAISTASVKIRETAGKYHFSPKTTYVNVGGNVTWKNGSDAAHTVTSDSGSELASASLGAGKTYSHTFAAAGSFPYHCTIHDYMVGKVVVLAAGVTAPPTDTVSTSLPPSADTNGALLVILVLAGSGGAILGLRRFRRAA